MRGGDVEIRTIMIVSAKREISVVMVINADLSGHVLVSPGPALSAATTGHAALAQQ